MNEEEKRKLRKAAAELTPDSPRWVRQSVAIAAEAEMIDGMIEEDALRELAETREEREAADEADRLEERELDVIPGRDEDDHDE